MVVPSCCLDEREDTGFNRLRKTFPGGNDLAEIGREL
jgi:hypothetical protein